MKGNEEGDWLGLRSMGKGRIIEISNSERKALLFKYKLVFLFIFPYVF